MTVKLSINTPPYRILYAMIRVSNLQMSKDFYSHALGMKILREETYTEGRFTLVFMGYGVEENDAVLELTHNWDEQSYRHGNRYGHLALGVSDLEESCRQMKAIGVSVIREPGPMLYSPDHTDHFENIAFITDPDGYRIELVEQPDLKNPTS